MSKYTQVAELKVAGQFLGFLFKDGYKIEYLRLGTPQGEFWFKPAKELRPVLEGYLNPGDAIEIGGEGKRDLKSGKLKLKAYEVKRAGEREEERGREGERERTELSKNASILICQKSDCQKRGGKAICEALEAGLRDRNLSEQVKIKGTGCLKQCKAGPNLVFMPDKTRYSKVSPAQIPNLIAKHFPISGSN
ncbi:MAG: (2Fe-2S) ferredoxin domain-containing protein [Cyanosarcina radialis HA8281-LM2]|jgi:(2Fe-2S) ferredoxin|nr:(2Fe-2S) ferredoxin domain-containing protein [Cyanosarcina radialis HA8281-LM2]